MAVVADRSGPYAAVWVPVAACAVAARPGRGRRHRPAPAGERPDGRAEPLRADRYLHRIHGVSVLLVVPQFVVWTFALVWLVQDRDWSAASAGALVAGAQVAGALGRIAAGQLSDVVASRMRPLRWVTVAAVATMLALGAAAGLDVPLAVPLVVLATMVTVADNGLAFTAVAERAGPFWSGRALALQNTAQFLAAAAVPAAGGARGDVARATRRRSRWPRCSRSSRWRWCRSARSASCPDGAGRGPSGPGSPARSRRRRPPA